MLLATSIGLLGLVGILLSAAIAWTEWRARRQLFSEVNSVPKVEFGVVLGCAPVLRDGTPNFYFEARLDAAAELVSSDRVVRLIVSGGPIYPGSDGRESECDAMRDGLALRGVPAERVTLDTSGTRTWLSVVRTRDVFGVSRAIFVTQRFHAVRAVFLARRAGLDAYAYLARSPSLASRSHVKVLMREVFSRARAILDTVATK